MSIECLSSQEDERYDMIMFISVTFIQSVYRIVIYKQGIEDNGLFLVEFYHFGHKMVKNCLNNAL